MKSFLRAGCCFLLVISTNQLSFAGPQQAQTASVTQNILEDGTPVKLRIAQTISSADAQVNDRVEFEVLEELKIADVVVIPKGGIALGTVTEAQPKRRLGRGGKLEIVMDSVRLSDGEKTALRATKEATGGSHTGAMTAGIVVTGLILWPAAPFFLFMHGKDITIPKGTEVPTFVSGNFPLDFAKFQAAPATQSASVQSAVNATDAQVEITSAPAGADIDLDGSFVGSTPSTLGVQPGDHTLTVKKDGYKPWERNIKVTTGKIGVSASLEAADKTN
jgi:hypothetical protein